MEKKSSLLGKLKNEPNSREKKRVSERMKLAARIDDLIQARGWSRAFFASLMAKEPSVISRWLSGTHNFTMDTLSDIVAVFEVELEDLFRPKPAQSVFKTHFAVTGFPVNEPHFHSEDIIVHEESASSIYTIERKKTLSHLHNRNFDEGKSDLGSLISKTRADVEANSESIVSSNYKLKA